MQPRLTIVPVTLAYANAWVAKYHRHHLPVGWHRFSVGVVDDSGMVRGIAIANRPVAIALDDGQTLEVSRCCTDGCANACSALYGACKRTAKDLGYHRIVTYTLLEEHGASLRGAGWTQDRVTGGDTWERPKRSGRHTTNPGPKRRWSCTLREGSTIHLRPSMADLAPEGSQQLQLLQEG